MIGLSSPGSFFLSLRGENRLKFWSILFSTLILKSLSKISPSCVLCIFPKLFANVLAFSRSFFVKEPSSWIIGFETPFDLFPFILLIVLQYNLQSLVSSRSLVVFSHSFLLSSCTAFLTSVSSWLYRFLSSGSCVFWA